MFYSRGVDSAARSVVWVSQISLSAEVSYVPCQYAILFRSGEPLGNRIFETVYPSASCTSMRLWLSPAIDISLFDRGCN
jgi:hypothetical protein